MFTYADGETRRFPVVEGTHVHDWYWGAMTLGEAHPAWVGAAEGHHRDLAFPDGLFREQSLFDGELVVGVELVFDSVRVDRRAVGSDLDGGRGRGNTLDTNNYVHGPYG